MTVDTCLLYGAMISDAGCRMHIIKIQFSQSFSKARPPMMPFICMLKFHFIVKLKLNNDYVPSCVFSTGIKNQPCLLKMFV